MKSKGSKGMLQNLLASRTLKMERNGIVVSSWKEMLAKAEKTSNNVGWKGYMTVLILS